MKGLASESDEVYVYQAATLRDNPGAGGHWYMLLTIQFGCRQSVVFEYQAFKMANLLKLSSG
ncbi:hypothetical protein [Methylomonas methanica]|uniref:hypothetical protein n=1 Tax=Methylomonas methanica TaxID=421 RepID=UPI0002E52F15|nr:hypothetical protein [Methylomonas methanica]